MPDDHSEVVPLLPIPNRTVKRLCADDSADSRVKVGHRQASTAKNAQPIGWAFFFAVSEPLCSREKGIEQGFGAFRVAIEELVNQGVLTFMDQVQE